MNKQDLALTNRGLICCNTHPINPLNKCTYIHTYIYIYIYIYIYALTLNNTQGFEWNKQQPNQSLSVCFMAYQPL